MKIKTLFLLILFIVTTIQLCLAQSYETNNEYAGTIWYNYVGSQLNHESFIRFDKKLPICSICFMGENKPSEIHDFIYNKNDKDEFILCRPEEPMRPVVILIIQDDNILELNLLDLSVGNKYKKIHYTGV